MEKCDCDERIGLRLLNIITILYIYFFAYYVHFVHLRTFKFAKIRDLRATATNSSKYTFPDVRSSSLFRAGHLFGHYHRSLSEVFTSATRDQQKSTRESLKPTRIWTADFKVPVSLGGFRGSSPDVVCSSRLLVAHPTFSTHATTVIEGCGTLELRAKVCFAADLFSAWSYLK